MGQRDRRVLQTRHFISRQEIASRATPLDLTPSIKVGASVAVEYIL